MSYGGDCFDVVLGGKRIGLAAACELIFMNYGNSLFFCGRGHNFGAVIYGFFFILLCVCVGVFFFVYIVFRGKCVSV